MPNIKCIIEYDGSYFHGFQYQKDLKTVQSALHETLETILREKIHCIHGSGRTDAGVHAKAQVISFKVENPNVDLHVLKHSVSSILRKELSVIHAEIVDDNFHPLRDAKTKIYVYRILSRETPSPLNMGKVWHVGDKIDFERISKNAKALEGTHDFTSFRGSGCSSRTPIKTIFKSDFLKEGDELVYRVEGAGFLKHMVRNIVGTLIDIERGLIRLSINEILEKRDRKIAGITAPAYGLCLEKVIY